MSCKILALTLLLDAVDDVTGRDRTDLQNVIYKDTTQGEGRRLKNCALDFFFSRESEPYCLYWCDMAGQPLLRFRRRLKDYKKE